MARELELAVHRITRRTKAKIKKGESLTTRNWSETQSFLRRQGLIEIPLSKSAIFSGVRQKYLAVESNNTLILAVIPVHQRPIVEIWVDDHQIFEMHTDPMLGDPGQFAVGTQVVKWFDFQSGTKLQEMTVYAWGLYLGLTGGRDETTGAEYIQSSLIVTGNEAVIPGRFRDHLDISGFSVLRDQAVHSCILDPEFSLNLSEVGVIFEEFNRFNLASAQRSALPSE
ncbi:hypothetical protein HY988_02685 [Candidatus Micrarchaeota archaeon]|nr:hypothetical protein [Candidatus Micrarchaeota archaeon]